MHLDHNEEDLLRSVALQNAKAILLARERAERDSRDARERVISILESITDGFFAVDREWRFTYVNLKGEEILRRLQKGGSETLLGNVLWEQFPGIVGTELERNCRRAHDQQLTVDFETYVEPLRQWFEVRAYPAPDGLSVYFHDITERRVAEEARRASEQQLRATFHQAAIGMAVAGLNGRFEQVNARFSEVLGYSTEELLGLTFLDITHPDDIASTKGNVSHLVSGEGGPYIHEKRYVRKDGAYVWSLTSVTLLRDAAGRPEKFVGVIEDITTRKEAEAAVRESAQRLQLALSVGRLGDWSWEAETDVMSLGPAAREAFGIADQTPKTWADVRALMNPEDRDAARNALAEALATKSDYNAEYRIIANQRVRWIAVKARGVYPSDQPAKNMIGVVQDITAQREADEIRSRLAAVVESSDDAIISMSLDTIINTWNGGAERTFGYTAAEVIGKAITILIPPGYEDEEPRILQRLLRGERIDHYETIRAREDGTLLNVSLTVSPVRDAKGRIIGVSKISRDITGQKRAEAALRRSEEELRVLADSMPQLAWIAHADGSIFWYNQRWYHYTGKTLEEMQGWGWQSVHDPEFLPSVIERWKHSISSGIPFEMEFPLRGSDGFFRWFLTRVNPIRDASGRVLRWFGTNTDVEEVRRAQLALTEETRVLELLNQTGTAIASQLDLETVVQTVTDSATALTGAQFGAFFYNVTNEQGETFQLYTLSGAPRSAFEKFGHPRATDLFGPTFRGEGVVRSDDVTADPRYGKMSPHFGMPKGHLPVKSYLAVPVFSRNGSVIGGLFFGHSEAGIFSERSERLVVGVAAQAAIAIDNARLYDAAQREIAERRRIEGALREAEAQLREHAEQLEEQVAERTARLRETIQELEAFSYSVSHDMRSPLRAMQGYSDALLEDYRNKLDETAQEYLRRIARAASRMDLLIQDVLAYSRVSQGEIQLQSVDVEEVIAEVIQNYPALQPANASVTIMSRIPPVCGHEAYMTQIVSNFLTNAVKFVRSGTKPEVKIYAKEEGEMLHLTFEDNGIGIAPQHQQQIFQIFGRVYSDKKFEGTGIGLAIAKKAAERMGGSVGVVSQIGSGSQFYVRLRRVT